MSIFTKEKKSRKLFTPDEDARLTKIKQEQPLISWIDVAHQMPGRSPRQCRDRWTNYLSPEIKNYPWSVEEDQLLIKKVEEFGPQWTIIARFFDGRSENNVKNRWHTHLKPKGGLNPSNVPTQYPSFKQITVPRVPSSSVKPMTKVILPPISTIDEKVPNGLFKVRCQSPCPSALPFML